MKSNGNKKRNIRWTLVLYDMIIYLVVAVLLLYPLRRQRQTVNTNRCTADDSLSIVHLRCKTNR